MHRASKTNQLDGSAKRVCYTAQLDKPVLYISSLGQFAYSKIDLSVCTLILNQKFLGPYFVNAIISLLIVKYNAR